MSTPEELPTMEDAIAAGDGTLHGTIDRLTRELEVSRLECEEKAISLSAWLCANAPGGWIDDLRLECERLRVDAERYRTWRDRYCATTNDLDNMLMKMADAWEPSTVDALLDTARSAASGESAEGVA